MKILIVIAAWLAASSAGAQVVEPPPGPPDFPTRSLFDLDRDRSETEALILASEHPALFEDVTDYQGPSVRHRASGLVCMFSPGARANGINVYKTEGQTEDVGCGTNISGVALTHYAYRYSPPLDPEQQTHEAIAAIRERFPDLKAYDGEIAAYTTEGFERPRTYVSRAVVSIDGVEHLTKVMVCQIGDWTLKQRMTVRLDHALEGDRWSEVMMLRAAMAVSASIATPLP